MKKGLITLTLVVSALALNAQPQSTTTGIGLASEPTVVISLDNLNYLYAGVENPFTPAVSGVDSRNIQVHVDPKDGMITPGEKAGSYNIVPTGAGRNLEINVTATIDGKQQNMGSILYRVIPIPNPILKVNGYESGGQPESKKLFTEGNTIILVKDPNFNFEIESNKMRIIEVEAYINIKPIGRTPGNKITAEMAAGIKRAHRGDRLIINARVSMPDGKPVTIDWIKQLK